MGNISSGRLAAAAAADNRYHIFRTQHDLLAYYYEFIFFKKYTIFITLKFPPRVILLYFFAPENQPRCYNARTYTKCRSRASAAVVAAAAVVVAAAAAVVVAAAAAAEGDIDK